ncbi:MAG: SDR family NAD(P)-dependent oxidoreductase [Chitinophagaceae bacterium]|jgi:decaprenylphospho-beta-D-erythro-pentofuranosid-2-ulose 2-reductase|nr:SDR family NAD(P)-dependent oxidoreductase [Chitinophagaceae bacterium]
MSQTIAIFGANSAIAKEYARLDVRRSDQLILVARSEEALESLKSDLATRHGQPPKTIVYDFQDLKNLTSLVNDVFALTVDTVLIAFGTLPDQKKCESDVLYLQEQYQLNSTSTILLLSLIAEKLKKQRHGTLAVITSVAGDRGKTSNYFYGSAKASVSTLLQGLRQDLFKSDVHVLDVKPGFVDTPMTADFDKGLLWTNPESIALGIEKSIRAKKNTVYLPFFWSWIMCVIKLIPGFIFNRMKL